MRFTWTRKDVKKDLYSLAGEVQFVPWSSPFCSSHKTNNPSVVQRPKQRTEREVGRDSRTLANPK